MNRILVICLILLFFSGIIFAQQPPSPVVKMQREMQGVRQEKENSKPYKQRQDVLENQTKINAIVVAFREGKISSFQAESQLSPLVKQEMQDDINNLESRIARLEKELEFLKRAKANPDLLIKERIDQMLGKAMPTPDELME